MNQLLRNVNDELAEIITCAQGSLVQVDNGRAGAGAGTIVHEEGLIVTNAHVVRRRSPRITLWDGRTMKARLLGFDESLDLAAIAVGASGLPAIPLAGNKEPRAGQWVVALGHPWGIRGAASAGMIIDVGPPVEKLPYRGDLVQVGITLRPGHSGGPMLNSRGELVGINTMISGPKVGMAVPVRAVKRFLKQTLGRDRQPVTADWHAYTRLD